MKSSKIWLSMESLIAVFFNFPTQLLKFLYWVANLEFAFNSMHVRGFLQVS